jgi:hypothetical protein
MIMRYGLLDTFAQIMDKTSIQIPVPTYKSNHDNEEKNSFIGPQAFSD